MKAYNQLSQSAVYREDETAVSLTVCGGSYGGGSEVLVLESNQNHATIKDTEICPTLPASMGMGGGYVPMIVAYGFDSYNQAIELETAQPIRSHGGGDETAKVIEVVIRMTKDESDNPNSVGFTRKSDN